MTAKVNVLKSCPMVNLSRFNKDTELGRARLAKLDDFFAEVAREVRLLSTAALSARRKSREQKQELGQRQQPSEVLQFPHASPRGSDEPPRS